MPKPDDALVRWVIDAAAPGASVEAITGLRAAGSPWLIRLARSSGSAGPAVDVVLRLGTESELAGFQTEVAALEVARSNGVPAPVLLAADLAGQSRPGVLAVLSTRVTGTSRLTAEPSSNRLRALGAAAAAVHRTPAPSSTALPRRESPIGDVDFGALRRVAPARPLLVEAERVLALLPVPERPVVFVHGDLWHGNTLWDGAVLTGLVDWDCAGVGQPGVDLGSLRCDAALCAGPGAADDVLAGYQAATGRLADDVDYWDLVAALATPPTIDWFVEAIRDQGRADLDQPTLLARRDAFLAAALERLS